MLLKLIIKLAFRFVLFFKTRFEMSTSKYTVDVAGVDADEWNKNTVIS